MNGEAIVHAADVAADIKDDIMNVKKVYVNSQRLMSEHHKKKITSFQRRGDRLILILITLDVVTLVW